MPVIRLCICSTGSDICFKEHDLQGHLLPTMSHLWAGPRTKLWPMFEGYAPSNLSWCMELLRTPFLALPNKAKSIIRVGLSVFSGGSCTLHL